ncbi:MAG TPA: hypothetical protein EYN67_01210 [Flavobacteriales bacterium]|nr:hypothetical protein [Methylococcaceae bacterium]HHZ94186.1 hypothetical protein [Flavobacteriales bacterium]
MTINGVEQNCLKTQSIVCLLDVLETGYMRKFTTAKQYKVLIKFNANRLGGGFCTDIKVTLLSVINDSLTTADHYTAAIAAKMDELRKGKH